MAQPHHPMPSQNTTGVCQCGDQAHNEDWRNYCKVCCKPRRFLCTRCSIYDTTTSACCGHCGAPNPYNTTATTTTASTVAIDNNVPNSYAPLQDTTNQYHTPPPPPLAFYQGRAYDPYQGGVPPPRSHHSHFNQPRPSTYHLLPHPVPPPQYERPRQLERPPQYERPHHFEPPLEQLPMSELPLPQTVVRSPIQPCEQKEEQKSRFTQFLEKLKTKKEHRGVPINKDSPTNEVIKFFERQKNRLVYEDLTMDDIPGMEELFTIGGVTLLKVRDVPGEKPHHEVKFTEGLLLCVPFHHQLMKLLCRADLRPTAYLAEGNSVWITFLPEPHLHHKNTLFEIGMEKKKNKQWAQPFAKRIKNVEMHTTVLNFPMEFMLGVAPVAGHQFHSQDPNKASFTQLVNAPLLPNWTQEGAEEQLKAAEDLPPHQEQDLLLTQAEFNCDKYDPSLRDYIGFHFVNLESKSKK